MRFRALFLALALLAAGGACDFARAEVVEEIVAWVNGEIITKSDLDQAEQEVIAALYRQFTGQELDQQVEVQRSRLLQDLIDRKILVSRAGRIFDLDIMGKNLLEMVQEQQGISNEAEFNRLLAEEGLDREEFKEQLIYRVAPDEVIRMEVGNRVAIGDAACEAYYNENTAEFYVDAEVTLREIVLLAEGDAAEARRAEAEEIWKKATAPDADFGALAEEYSEAGTADEGGKLGPLTAGDLSDQLAEVARNAPVGSVSELLAAPYGFHIVKVESREDARQKSLDEVREEIRRQLEERDYYQRLEAFLERAREEAEWEVNEKYRHRL